MNKYIYILATFLCCNCLIIRAQNNRGTEYVVDNIFGEAEIQEASDAQWEPAHNNQKVFGYYRLKIGNKLDLTKGKYEKTIYKTGTPVLVDYAWDNPNPKLIKHGVDAIYNNSLGPALEESKDSIGFCFITTEGDWRIDGRIFITDSLEAIAINHTSPDTLYACGYWSFSNGFCYPMSYYIPNPVFILLPNKDNIIHFINPVPVTIEEESVIVLLFNKHIINYSEIDGIPLEEFKKTIPNNDLNCIEFKVQCDHE